MQLSLHFSKYSINFERGRSEKKYCIKNTSPENVFAEVWA